MKYLNLFETDATFAAAKDSFPSGANVSYVRETDNIHILKVINLDELPIGPFVDLGLPSGKKWASCNLGATRPCDYGDYYMWGSISANTNDTCDWAHTPFNNGSSSYNATYFNANKSEWLDGDVLKPEYDAVAAATNGAAHMPTKEDYDELLANTTSEWVTCVTALGHEGHTAVNGRLFTSKSDSTKKIFIPASGYRSGFSFDSRSSDTYLSSSSLDASNLDSSWYLYFDNGDILMNGNYRYHGFCVRGVADK